MDINQVIATVVESSLGFIKPHLVFLVSSSKKVKSMHEELKKLDGAAHDMHAKQLSNKVNRRGIPDRVSGWLEDVTKIKGRANKIPKERVGCFNLKTRYKAGKDSSHILEEIVLLMDENNKMVWHNEIIPLGVVSPPRLSTSSTIHEDIEQNIIESRFVIFNDALRSLEPNNIKAQKVALCGMAGVGKTRMMEELVEAANEKKMFNLIVNVVVGLKPNLADVQAVVGVHTGGALDNTNKDTRARAELLKERFKKLSKDGKKKILVILDDVFEEFNLNDIGLASPLPKGFKLLLTSRDEGVCTQMGVLEHDLHKINVLKAPEAQKLFWDTIGLLSDTDIEHDLHQIGEDIIRKCCGLPISIATIASTLKDKREKDEWKDALFRIQNKDFHVLINIFEYSYQNLEEDDLKATFLLSGLFPEDYNIGIEDLVLYGWGLKFFRNVHDISIVRSRVNTYVNKLIRSNLLIKSDHEGCVRMHDLVRDFVLSSVSKVKQASIVINNNDVSEKLKEVESYDRILIRCGDMCELPEDFNYPNLSLLTLMDGDRQLKFPQDFYTRMEKVEVVAFENIYQPLLPQNLTNLRALFLRSCSLVDDDISFLGDLINLEVLSLAKSLINKLPSKIGKLKKLKLLDLTGCHYLCIDDGVLQNFDKLKELYLGTFNWSPIRFTDANCYELKMLSCKLSALELEFFENKAQPVDVTFENLERFRLSIGCQLDKVDYERGCGYSYKYSFKNTLKLVTSSTELHHSKINELFCKTEILHLEVNDMSYLDNIVMHPPQNPFYNLKALSISKCAGLTYLFTIYMAKGLTKLESLKISSCPFLKSIVNGESSEATMITIHKLKTLSLRLLPEFISLCDPNIAMELPQLTELDISNLQNITSIFSGDNTNISVKQPFLNKEIMIPKLEKLTVGGMKNLKELWPCEITMDEEQVNDISALKVIKVWKCNKIVNLFPSNSDRLLSHLEYLKLEQCGSIEVLFNIDFGKIDKLSNNSSLKRIKAWNCKSLRAVWRIKDPENKYYGQLIRGYPAVEYIYISYCEGFRSLVTPTTFSFDMRALKDITIWGCEEYGERTNVLVDISQEQEVKRMPKEEISKDDDNMFIVAFPSYKITQNFHHLRKIEFFSVKEVDVVFDIESPRYRDQLITTQQQPQPLLPYLEELNLEKMDSMIHVWKCSNWNEFFVLHEQQPQLSSIQNLTTIQLKSCHNIKYLFSSCIVKLLSNLKKVDIEDCVGMEEVVSNRDEEEITTSTHTTTTFIPHLDIFRLCEVNNLKQIGGVGVAKGTTNGQSKFSVSDVVYWSLCQYSTEIDIQHCRSITKVFETQEYKNNNIGGCSSSSSTMAIPRPTISSMHCHTLRRVRNSRRVTFM